MSSEGSTKHVSVMRDEVLAGLLADQGGDFIDCTLGGAGHTESILEANPRNTVLGCDRDERALERAARRLARFGPRFSSAKASFSELSEVCGGRKFDGLLADLGISTDQLYEDRGFSFRDNSSLDMRMDESSPLTAHEVVNEYSERDLLKALKEGGVGINSRTVARAIIRARPILNTTKLAELVASVLASRFANKKTHPATVVFQAIRMEVNKELSEISSLLEQMPNLVKDKGRGAIICFHSGEDRLVTNTLRKWAGSQEAPAWWMGDRSGTSLKIGKLLQNDAQTPTKKEVEENAASRSARLRVFIFGNV